jgi:chromosome segregation ATPase
VRVGSTIEMLRSENVNVRSQVSAMQRRMLQEKQQLADYLRQIEHDLVEKEQAKQRVRREFEQLQVTSRQHIEQLTKTIDDDRTTLNELERQCSRTSETLRVNDERHVQVQTELDRYKTIVERLYAHLALPLDSVRSIDQLTMLLDERDRAEPSRHVRSTRSLIGHSLVRRVSRRAAHCRRTRTSSSNNYEPISSR